MNLYPQDLGAKRQLALLWRRARRAPPAPDATRPRIGAWERGWIGGDRYQAGPETVLPALQAMRRPGRFWSFVGLAPLPAAVCAGIALANGGDSGALAVLFLAPVWAGVIAGACPRALFDRTHRRLNDTPVSAAEIAGLLPEAHDELERAYLTLVLDVARQEVAPHSEADLRPALRALGDAIDKLPATRVVADSPDILTEVLRRTAAETLQTAQAEPDRVVAASLVRRAEALHRRADATHRAALLVRRFAVLRQEMAAETETLRAGLAAYYTGAHDIADLTRLAEDVRRVAAEAAAVTAAVEEVDSLLAAPAPRPAPDTAPAQLRLGPG